MLFYADKSRCYNNNSYQSVNYHRPCWLLLDTHFDPNSSLLNSLLYICPGVKTKCPVFQKQKTYPPHQYQWPTPCRETCLTVLQSTLLTSCSCVFCTRCTFNQSQAPRWGVRCLRWGETREVSHTKFTHNTCLGFRPVDSRHTAHSLCTEYQVSTSFCPSDSLRSVNFV